MDALLEGGTMLWTRHLGFIGGASAQLIIQGFWGNVILSTRSRKFIGEGILSELAI